MSSSAGTGHAVLGRPHGKGGGRPALAVMLEALLVAGLDLAVTGALGHCPLYAKPSYVPKSLRRIR